MPYRVVFYCHQVRGLGHLALSLHLAQTLARDKAFTVALTTGSSLPIPFPDGVKRIVLPDLKEPIHRPEMTEILRNRSQTLVEFCRQWQPDCMIVDQVPLGIGGELLPVFEAADKEAWRTQFALGVAYVEGLPRDPGRNPKAQRACAKFSLALGYADREFAPVLEELSSIPNVKVKHYLGAAVPRPARHVPRRRNDLKRVVVLCGGGCYNTAGFLDLVIAACRPWLEKKIIRLACVAGVLAGNVSLQPENEDVEGVTIHAEGRAEESVAEADVIISRSGYNTAFTVIQSPAPVIFVPVNGQEFEQLNRAAQLTRLERVWSVVENRPGSADALAAAMRSALDAPVKRRPLPFRTDGAKRLAAFLKAVL